MTERDSGKQEHEREFDGRVFDATPTDPAAEYDESATTSDMSAIHADDALLDALGGADPRIGDGLGDQELNALLLAWRRDVDSEPIPELVDTPAAVTTVKTATLARRGGGRGRRRMLVPVAAAAAVLAIGFTGTALAARDAQPGDTLWALSKVLYADHARSVEAAASVRTDLHQAHLAIAQERYDDARAALEQAERELSKVTVEDQVAQLRARHTELLAQLDRPADKQQPPATSSTTNSSPSSEDSDTATSTDSPTPSSEPEVPPELEETSSVPTTVPSPSTEPSPSTSSTQDSTADESGSSRYGTSSSGDVEPSG